MLIALLIVVGVLAVIGIYVWVTYNRLVGQRLNVDNSWSQIEVALKRRHDLIPNLVETVRGYATHERQTFENVTAARSQAVAAEGPAQQAQAEGILGAALGRLFAVAEAYPDLKANQNFLSLQGELANTENQIAVTRRVYNDTVQTYNTQVQVFPALIVARMFNFQNREFFDVPDEQVEQAPRVDFSSLSQAGAGDGGTAAAGAGGTAAPAGGGPAAPSGGGAAGGGGGTGEGGGGGDRPG